MMKLLIALALALALAGPAQASEKSQALSARAVIALNAGDTAGARALLDQAVAADPDDADVRYQRGVLRGRGGDTAGAVEDLERALALRPWFPVAALELGIALIDEGRAAAAEPPLLQAQQVPALDAQASFYLALAQLRLGRMDLARASLARAREGDASLTTATRYYEGVIAYREGDYTAAEEAFASVQRERADTAMGREAGQYLVLIADSRSADYSAFGTFAMEYDSNVTLGPTQTVPGSVSGEADGRAVFNLGGRWTPLRYGGASLSLSYEFFQSLQFDLTDFDLQDNRPAAQLQYDYGVLSVGLLGRYDYYLLGSDSFLSEVTAMPWVTIREEGFGRTEMYVRVQPRDYKQIAYSVLNGVYTFAGIRQYFDIGNAAQQIWLGYQLGTTNPDSTTNVTDQFFRDQYQYGSQMAEIGIRWPLPFEILGEAAYRYENQSYGAASGCLPNGPGGTITLCTPGTPLPAGLDRREDNDHRVILSFERRLPEIWEHLSVVAAYFGTFNDSNKSAFEYDRNIGSLGLQVRY